MSHFTVLVIGDNIEDQLAPYDEKLETEEYFEKEVSEKEIKEFVDFYAEKSPENKKLSVEELYKKVGEDWNYNCWRFEDGKINEYSTYNPDSKWDWWVVGGRWRGYFKLKEGKTGELGESGLGDNDPEYDADIALKGDIDGKIQPTFAVVKDGEWYEKGNMGWWGIVSNRKEQKDWDKEFERLLKDVSDDTLLTIIDCHI